MEEKTKTVAVNLAVIALIGLLLVWGNSWYRQWRLFGKGEEALAANYIIAAVADYGSAIHMYTPFSPLVERSAERLWKITLQCAEAGDRNRALIACRTLRSSFYSVRWLCQPGKEWISRCDRKIDELLEAGKNDNGTGRK